MSMMTTRYTLQWLHMRLVLRGSTSTTATTPAALGSHIEVIQLLAATQSPTRSCKECCVMVRPNVGSLRDATTMYPRPNAPTVAPNVRAHHGPSLQQHRRS